MENKVDLLAVIEEVSQNPNYDMDKPYPFTTECMKKAIHYALVLFVKKAKVIEDERDTGLPMVRGGTFTYKYWAIDRKSIDEVEKLII